jgi:uncharacterized protein YukE
MAQSIVVKDAGALEQFAGRISQAKTQMEQVAQQLRGAISQVSGSWQDPQKEKCAKEIEAIIRAVNSFAKEAEAQATYCRRLAQHVKSPPR